MAFTLIQGGGCWAQKGWVKQGLGEGDWGQADQVGDREGLNGEKVQGGTSQILSPENMTNDVQGFQTNFKDLVYKK